MTEQNDTTDIEKLNIEDLCKLSLFQDMSAESVRTLLKDCPIKVIAADEILIHAGQRNDTLYLLLSGHLRVHLDRPDGYPVAVLDPGESVGEISVIDRQPTSACVIAQTEATVICLDEVRLWEMVRSSHDVAYNLLWGLAQRMRFSNSVIRRIQDLLREYEYDATIDALTGLYNRRWLDNTLRKVMHRSRQDSHAFSIIMIDIDEFKKFNDSFGHVAGDRALHTVSEALKFHMRPQDTITRFGGEELLALLPGLPLDGATRVAERLCQAIAETPIKHSDGTDLPSVTISLGVAQMSDELTPEALISRADKALYKAKEKGRNQVCINDE